MAKEQTESKNEWMTPSQALKAGMSGRMTLGKFEDETVRSIKYNQMLGEWQELGKTVPVKPLKVMVYVG